MKQAWQSVASVARSTTPCSIGTSSSDEETSLMTPYSVRFSCRSAHSSDPSGAEWYSLTATARCTSCVRSEHASGRYGGVQRHCAPPGPGDRTALMTNRPQNEDDVRRIVKDNG